MALDEAAKRRVRAGRLLQQGRKPAAVAQLVGAQRQTVYRWLDALNDEGIEALRGMSKGGRPAQLDGAEHERLREILVAGAQAAGFGTDLWTLKRACARRSRSASGCDTARCTCGACWDGSASPARNPRSVPPSATRRALRAGGGAPGRC